MSIEGTQEIHPSEIDNQAEPRHRMNPWIRVLIYVLILGGGSYLGWRIYQNQQAAVAQARSRQRHCMSRPIPVQVAAVAQRPMPIYLTALGTVMPYMSVTVKARVNGQLLPVKFTEGQEVKQGQTIMVIDPRPYQAALDQAKGTLAHDEALLKDAQAEYARYKALYAAGVVSKETMEADEATQGQYQGAIESDKAAIENAQLQLNWCYIQSPINGRIGLRLVDPGNIITANTTNLVIINQFQPIAVYFTLPENQLPQVLAEAGGRQAAAGGCLRPGRRAEAGNRPTADGRQPDRHDHRNGQAEGGVQQRERGAFPQPVCEYPPGDGRPAECAGGAVGGDPERVAGIVCVGGGTDAKGAATAQMQPVKVALGAGPADHSGQRGCAGAEGGCGRRRPAAAGGQVTVSQSRAGRAAARAPGQKFRGKVRCGQAGAMERQGKQQT